MGRRALDAEHALTHDAEGAGILRKGSVEPARVCPVLGSLSIPPVASRVDCAQAVAHGASGLTRIRVTRRDFAGTEREVLDLEADGERRIVHPSAQVLFYDDAGVPLAVLMGVATARDYRHRPIDCASPFRTRAAAPGSCPGPIRRPGRACWSGDCMRRGRGRRHCATLERRSRGADPDPGSTSRPVVPIQFLVAGTRRS
jgi:hypothetical protein